MTDKYLPYVGLARLLNSLESERDIKIFLSKYKHWYIKERNLSKNEAEDRVKRDIRFFIDRFMRNDDLIRKIVTVTNVVYS